ncbi:MAPEG family protein [Stappia sp. ES.058]|uniref:MAPEG family protein n=1 Tax=Stappia sp. ES.058 TaxID=1881061 RepID=UPI0008793F66|nr:MAPEG family protein [Stappia sp. ES.058]SDU27440.1 hypothetical protein SAMN05428979_2678 [Stappia sp. ES.058]
MIAITPIYAGVLALVFLVLSARVARRRIGARIALGTGGDPRLLRLTRAQGNCAEYAPIGLLLVLLIELQGGPEWLIHGLGLALVVGRTLHAVAVSREPEPLPLRVAGMVLTFSVLAIGALSTLGFALAQLPAGIGV